MLKLCRSARHLYHDTRVTAYRLEDTLRILLKIKVSFFSASLMLYRLDIFPLRVDEQHSMQIITQPQYIAINAVDKEFLTFQAKPAIDEQGTYYLQANEHQMMSKDNASCILALFMDDLINVRSVCQTVFQPYSAKPIAFKLDDDQFCFKIYHTSRLSPPTETRGSRHLIRTRRSYKCRVIRKL
jgi:hypothetical protein